MRRLRAGAMLNLHPAGLTIGQHRVASRGLDGGEEPAADFHREVVLLDLDAECARDATASLIDFFELHPRDQAQQAHRGVADAVGLQVAGGVIEQPRRDRLKVQVELAGLVQHPQVLADVVDAHAHLLRAGNVEQVAVVMLEHQPAGRRAGDDVDPRRQAVEAADILNPVFAGQVHVCVDHGGNAAALLLGDDHIDAVAFEDGDHLLSQTPLVVVDPAAVEVGHRAVSGQAPPP